MSLKRLLPALIGFAVAPCAHAAAAPSTPAYAVARTVALGAPELWDYLTFDPASHRVYVAHGDHLTVVDGRSGAIVGQVAGAPGGTHGIAIATAQGRGYTDDGKAGTVKVFDLKTLKVVKTLPAQPDADGVILDPTSGHVFVMDGDSGKVTVVDPHADRVVATIDVGGGLEFAVAGADGKVYVLGAEKREVVRIDTRSDEIDARWPIAACESPHGMAIDRQTRRLFVTCVNSRLLVVDATKGAVVATLPIGQGTDAAAFDPTRKLVFSSNGRSGDITVVKEIDADTYVAAGSIPTKVSARTMTIDPDSGRLYLVAGDVDPKSPPGARPRMVAGSARLMFLDPAR